MTYGERIKEIRTSLGLTQAQFGNAIGVSNGHISNVERDKDQLSAKATKALCELFGINEEWIQSGSGRKIEETHSIEERFQHESDVDLRKRLTQMELRENEALALRELFSPSYPRLFEMIVMLQAPDAKDFVTLLNLLIKEWDISDTKGRMRLEFRLEELIPNFHEKRTQLVFIEKGTPIRNLQNLSNRAAPSKFMLPIVGRSAAGLPIEMIEATDEAVAINGEVIAQPGDIVVIAVGDSMIDAGIRDGDRCLIHPQPQVEDGQVALVAVDNGSTIKRFYTTNKGFKLMPCNPDHQPQYYDYDAPIRVIGLFLGVIE